MNRRLYRCRHDRKIAGVASGVAEYFDLDPTPVRVAWFLSIFFGGLGIFLYIAMALIVPNEPYTADEAAAIAAGDSLPAHRHQARGGSTRWSLYLGGALVVFGGIALVDVVAPNWDSWRYLWPAVLIGLGALLVAGALRRDPTES